LDTDAILFFAPEGQAHGQLLRMQIEEWTPVTNWAQDTFGVEIHSRSGEKGIGQFTKQPPETMDVFQKWMEKYIIFGGR
jgi:chaperone required for assembly of F1-ATPase